MSEHKSLLPRNVTLADLEKKAASGHSVFSPSGSKMWLTCSGSLIPNLLAEDSSSPEAAEGTVAHGLAEEWLRSGVKPSAQVGFFEIVDEHEIEITDEMLAYVGDYVDYVEELREDSVEFLIETRVYFSDLTPIPKQGGTADSIAIVEIDGGYELVVTDLKYGKGVRVIAEGNSQGMIYAYGALILFGKKYNILRVRIRICHPRLEGGITETTVSVEELLDFAAYVKVRAHAAWDIDAPRTPSEDGCLWCKVQATCAARKAWLAEVTSGVFDDEDDDEPRTYTNAEQRAVTVELEDDLGPAPFRFADPVRLSTKAMARILKYRKGAEKFFAQIEEELLKRAQSREEDIPGWKIVDGRANRRWPEQDVPVYLTLKSYGLTDEAIYEEDIISPATAEKKLHAKAGLSKEEAAKVVNSLAIKPQGSRSLVRVTDVRKAAISSGDAFADDDD